MTLAILDECARNATDDSEHSHECGYADNGRNHVWQGQELTKHAVVPGCLSGVEVAIVVKVMGAIVAIRYFICFRLRMKVESGCK